jgi:hypothetical protein
VKAGTKYLSAVEREQIAALAVPANVSRECWRFPDRCALPTIEVFGLARSSVPVRPRDADLT